MYTHPLAALVGHTITQVSVQGLCTVIDTTRLDAKHRWHFVVGDMDAELYLHQHAQEQMHPDVDLLIESLHSGLQFDGRVDECPNYVAVSRPVARLLGFRETQTNETFWFTCAAAMQSRFAKALAGVAERQELAKWLSRQPSTFQPE